MNVYALQRNLYNKVMSLHLDSILDQLVPIKTNK